MRDRVIGYVRVSTQGQVKEGYSLGYQVEEIQRFCARHNLELLDIYKDEGISGAKVDEDELTIEREGLQEMLSDLKWRDVKYIVVLNTSRLWRADMVKVLIQRELKRYQVDVKAIEQPSYSIYAHDPNDFLVNGMMELLDQYQRLEIALKLSRGRRKKAQQGGYAGGRVAFGYIAIKGQKALSVDPVQAETVRRVFDLKAQHPTWSLAQIAAELNREGFTTVQGKPFSKVQVKRILDREDFYRGMYRYGQIEAKGVHQPII
ncbi:recombinase family protein [Brevibacillus borstelensis]|uniref:Resolvase domain-containing protein n=1 Tax=Brevibacillus borstelensis AK1 TaxID=1300222 RepID=M8D9I1_9BACL|nr:recombinase family protein [Brevibacillus borstelensis]EMT49952.1 resolvase domain-containing protein [Brevibacillus borstelensis AK1]KKX55316.1 resolvase [Brevibacillus borstelensis cifa_chp40]